MPLTEIFFIAGFFILQIIVIFLFFYRRFFEIIHKNLFRKTTAFLSVQLLWIFLLLSGGYLEKEERFYSDFRRPFDEYKHLPPETIKIAGDPDLLERIKNQEPILPRPNLTIAEELRIWQASLRQNLQTIFDLSNIGSPVDVQYHKISSTIIAQNIKRIFLTFTSFDGTSIPAYLFLPPSDSPQPAIIVLHGHIGEYEEGITQTGGLVPSYHNKAALELAKAGFVTFTIEFRGFGYLGSQINTNHKLVAYNAILGGSFYKAIISKDIKYAFDLLVSFPEVNPERIGITGVSLGGEMAVTYAALDERIKAIVFHSFSTSVGAKQGVFGKSTPQPFYTHIIPGWNTYLFQEDVYLLVAPRPLLGTGGSRGYSRVPEFSEILRKAYTTLNASSLFQFRIERGGHEYFVRPSIQFFKQHL